MSDTYESAVKVRQDFRQAHRLEKAKNKSLQDEIDQLREFAIWMTGCGYDFTQHDIFIRQRDRLLKTGEPDAKENTQTRKYTVGCAESLRGIALRELGDEERWDEIYTLNKLSNATMYPFTPGQIILLPTAQNSIREE